MCRFPIHVAVISLLLPFGLTAQSDAPAADANASAADPETWNLYYQATSIGDHHGTFNSPYQGPLSLEDSSESDVSLTTTLFFSLRLGHGTQFVFDPEIAGGRGFSHVDGLADAPILSEKDAAAPTLEEALRSGVLPTCGDCTANNTRLRSRF